METTSQAGCQQTATDPGTAAIKAYSNACRDRIPGFVQQHFSVRGAWALNTGALGRDLLIAPLNFLLGLPNFLIQLLAALLTLCKARRAGRWLATVHLGMSTSVHTALRNRLMNELLAATPGSSEEVQALMAECARQPVTTYINTRNVAADLTVGTLLAIVGLIWLQQFTPGSFSAGTVFAEYLAREQAIAAFPLGDLVGRAFYTFIPVSVSWPMLIMVILLLMAVLAVLATFAGILHDPIQAATGIHRRRLGRMLDAIEVAAIRRQASDYRPADTFVGRIYDFVDWIKALISL